MWHKLFCHHDFYMDKRITRIKCIKCGYSSWVLTGNSADLFPNGLSNLTKEEKILLSKKSFD